MTWSLRLTNGDLDLSQASLGIVTGQSKLVQDLRCYMLERLGQDDLHPEFGSVLDDSIGVLNDELASLIIESEIRRIVGDYQARQLDRARSDKATYGKATLSRGEILLAVTRIEIVQTTDTMLVTLHLSTGDGSALPLTFGLDS